MTKVKINGGQNRAEYGERHKDQGQYVVERANVKKVVKVNAKG